VGVTPALFDTNIVIDYLSGVQDAFNELSVYTDRAVSIGTWMEVMVGAKPDSEAQTRAVLNMFVLLPLTADVAERAVFERRQSRMKLPDAIILATAHQTGRILITRNTKDFSASHPLIRIPYRI
jgi:predicted nucleic acid-binding protein